MMDTLRNENARLLVLGSGPQEQMLKKEVADRQLGSKVRFMGFVEEMEKFRLLRLSDIYVSTSQHEGFGLVFLEAMACGLPVICYDYGGQTDFLEDGTTGYLAPLNDLQSFADRSLTLMRDPPPSCGRRWARITSRELRGFSLKPAPSTTRPFFTK
jgi:glycosyltransferase involved in cell wall biosynthesis